MNEVATIAFALRLATLAAFAWNVILFTRALRSAFSRPEGVPPLMRALAVCGTVATLLDGWLLWSASALLSFLIGGFTILILSQWVFRSAIKATAAHKLSLAFSTDVPTGLNQSGIYRRVRHPFYLAYALTWLGAVVGTLHLGAVLTLVVMLGFYVTAARREERKFLSSPLADAYREYQGRAGMFLPPLFLNQPTQPKPTK